MNNNIIKYIAAGFAVATLSVACSKNLDTTDENSPTQESYFKTASELQNGVNAVYSTLRSANLVGREWFFIHDMRGSEVWTGGPQLEPPRAELLKQASPSVTNAVMTSVWTGAYQMINRANVVISKAGDVNDNTALRDRLVGEAKFLRAWAYFELVSMWGDVPLYLTPVAGVADFKEKSPAADIYTAIVNDLKDAAAILPASYSGGDLGRATKGAANTLLGRVLMQNNDYAGAKTALLQVYNSGQYSLTANFSDNFTGDVKDGSTVLTIGTEFNAESIFEVAFVDRGDDDFNWAYIGEGATAATSTVRNQEYGPVWGNVIPSDALLNEFEANDPRYKFTFWEVGDKMLTKGGTVAGVTITPGDLNVDPSIHNGVSMKRIFKKYSILDWRNPSYHPGGINQRMMRYADVLLMLAECEAEVGTPTQAGIYINMVRARPSVNMPGVVLTSKQQAIAAVMHERLVELGGEEVNNIDMLRWRARNYYPSIRPDPKAGQVNLFPIPFAETSTNPKIQ
ncbi:MAG: RagB/SusD family nutrient uptake outer membrane protein [Citrobacter freundii]|nr:MAG: RagB/SusD family nutrient uptake outer membrane protein [Citrobacter freundii]